MAVGADERSKKRPICLFSAILFCNLWVNGGSDEVRRCLIRKRRSSDSFSERFMRVGLGVEAQECSKVEFVSRVTNRKGEGSSRKFDYVRMSKLKRAISEANDISLDRIS